MEKVTERIPPVWYYGCYSWCRRFFSSRSKNLRSMHNRSGKLYRPSWRWKICHFYYYDHILCSFLPGVAYTVSHKREKGAYHSGVFPGSSSNSSLPDASKSVDQPICSAFLGYLPEYSLCSSGPLHPSPVL